MHTHLQMGKLVTPEGLALQTIGPKPRREEARDLQRRFNHYRLAGGGNVTTSPALKVLVVHVCKRHLHSTKSASQVTIICGNTSEAASGQTELAALLAVPQLEPPRPAQ